MADLLASAHHATGGLWPYLVVILFGFLPSEIWRWMSVYFARGLSEDAEILIWVRAVASALLAGVVTKLLLTPLIWRLGSLLAGIAGFYFIRRSVLAGVVLGEVVLILAGFLSR
jgi:hypothetical protein